MNKKQISNLRKKCFSTMKPVPFWWDKEVFAVDIEEVEREANKARVYTEKLEIELKSRAHIKCPECNELSEYLQELEGFGCSNEDCGHIVETM